VREAHRVGVPPLPEFNRTENKIRDEQRSAGLRGCGVTELRFWNNEIMQNLPGVLEAIQLAAHELRAGGGTPTRRWRADLPLSGGG